MPAATATCLTCTLMIIPGDGAVFVDCRVVHISCFANDGDDARSRDVVVSRDLSPRQLCARCGGQRDDTSRAGVLRRVRHHRDMCR